VNNEDPLEDYVFIVLNL